MCVVGKNYRLQDIQLIKITGAPAFGLRAARSLAGPLMPRSASSHVVVAAAHFTVCDEIELLLPTRESRRRLQRVRVVLRPRDTRRAGGFRGPSEPAARQSRRRKQSGEYRARTGDLLVANQALSQLS